MSVTRQLKVLGSDTEGQWLAAALKVAFASTDMKTVNQHFGSAGSLVIYAVDMEQSKLLQVVQFGGIPADADEGKLLEKLEALAGCIAVYAQAMGTSAVGHLKAHGIQPVKVSAGAEISDLLASLQDELRMGPGVWLAKAMTSHMRLDPKRFDEMDTDGWKE